jgi:pimeloyl-ACP methyl ester carboxylesterase
MIGIVLAGLLIAAPGAPAATAPAEQQPFPGKRSDHRGYGRYDFAVDGCPTTVVVPRQAAAGKPWIWRAEFFDAFPQVDLALLAKGFHLVYINVGNTFGCPDALKHWDVLYRELTEKHGLARKPVLEGLSRGGLYCFNWAADNPHKVACILADNAVLDFKSWPGGKGKGQGSPGDWKKLLADYHFQSEAEALAYRKNPVDNLEPLARAKVPLFLLCGDADDVVPYPENGAVVKARYEKLGGPITVLLKHGLGHHPHGLTDPTPVVEFILRHTSPPGTPLTTTLEEQARPADAFADSIGVNVHLAYTYLPLRGAGAVQESSGTDRLAVEVPDHLLVLEIAP